MSAITLAWSLIAAIAAYLAILASLVVLLDPTLERFQKLAQICISLLVPVLGPVMVLTMAHDVTKTLLRWVPWPFRSLIANKPIKRYSSADDQTAESDAS